MLVCTILKHRHICSFHTHSFTVFVHYTLLHNTHIAGRCLVYYDYDHVFYDYFTVYEYFTLLSKATAKPSPSVPSNFTGLLSVGTILLVDFVFWRFGYGHGLYVVSIHFRTNKFSFFYLLFP